MVHANFCLEYNSLKTHLRGNLGGVSDVKMNGSEECSGFNVRPNLAAMLCLFKNPALFRTKLMPFFDAVFTT